MKKFIYLICLCSVGLFACKAPTFVEKDYDGKALYFGSGGGFTGKYNMHVLSEKGNLFQQVDTGYLYLGGMERQLSQQVFSLFESQNLMQMNFKRPGNFNEKLVVQNGDEKNEMIWEKGQQAPPQVANLYNILNHVIRHKKYEK